MMSALTPYWPEWTRLYWLLAAPIVLLLLWALQRTQHRQGDWSALLPQAFHAILLDKGVEQRHKRRYLLLGFAWLCAFIALLGPSWESTPTAANQAQHAAPLVIVIQLTPDMLANDLAPSRLHHVREKVLHLLHKRQPAFSALVVYAGSAHTLVPLSNDLLTSRNLLQALEPDLMPVSGQRTDLGIRRAIRLLEQGAQGTGQILLISTGVSISEQKNIRQALQGTAIQLKVMGVGTTAGAPIAPAAQQHFLTDASGAIVISRLNQTSLQLLAKHTQSPYSQISSDDSDLLSLDLLSLSNSSATLALAQAPVQQRDQGYWFILPTLILAAFFARRGSLLLVLLCLLPMQSFALDWAHLWLRPDQRGAQLIELQPTRAAHYFTDPLWRATALYLAEDYPAAAQLFAEFDSPQAHYNRGNALALAGLLEEALAAYQAALDFEPEMLAAQYNQALVQSHLKRATKEQNNSLENPTTAQSEQSSTALLSPSSSASTNQAQAASASDTQELATAMSSHASNPAAADTATQSPPLATSEIAPQSQVQTPIHLESWLEQIPDNPSELLKRKFLYEQYMQETTP